MASPYLLNQPLKLVAQILLIFIVWQRAADNGNGDGDNDDDDDVDAAERVRQGERERESDG